MCHSTRVTDTINAQPFYAKNLSWSGVVKLRPYGCVRQTFSRSLNSYHPRVLPPLGWVESMKGPNQHDACTGSGPANNANMSTLTRPLSREIYMFPAARAFATTSAMFWTK